MKWEDKAFTLKTGKRVYTADRLRKNRLMFNLMSGSKIKARVNTLIKSNQASRSDGANSELKPEQPEGLTFYPYQIAGIEYLIAHKKALLADDQGLGKTIQVAGLINEVQPERILIICPASLKHNWEYELNTWCDVPSNCPYNIEIVDGGKHKFVNHKNKFVRIVNYELCHKLQDKIGDDYDLVVLDEVHYLKNCTAKRTQAILGGDGIARRSERVVAISGTPVENRPIELWPMVASIFRKYWPIDLMSYRDYGEFFCAAYDEQVRVYDRKRGGVRYVKEFNVRGSSNLDTLNGLLRERFMLRRLKRDVLPQLPSKQYSVIDIAMSQTEKRQIGGLIRQEDEYAENVLRSIETGQRLPPMEDMASVRQELGLMKIPFATDFAKQILDSGESVILFVYHTAVAEALAENLKDYGVSMIIGKTPSKKRQQNVTEFQSGKNKVFVGNLIAAGTGLTLTKAHNVVFVESSWVPGQNEQAVDRAHRISQDKKVHAYFLTWYGSMDAQILRTSINKQKNINRIMK